MKKKRRSNRFALRTFQNKILKLFVENYPTVYKHKMPCYQFIADELDVSEVYVRKVLEKYKKDVKKGVQLNYDANLLKNYSGLKNKL